MKRLLILWVGLLCSASLYPKTTSVDPVPLEQGIKSALKGVAKHVYVKKHDFTIHKIKVTRTGNKTTITGQISHRLKWRDDDEFYYKIIKENGVVKQIPTPTIKYNVIKQGKDWVKENTLLSSLFTYVTGIPVNQLQKVDDLEKEFNKLTKGKVIEWEDAASYIVAKIALQVK